MATRRRWYELLLNRGSILFVTGLALTVHEALTRGPERPSLYILFAGMMGFPLVWTVSQGDNKREKK